jgi:hypothetical protein
VILFFVIVGVAALLGATAGYLLLRRWGRGPAIAGVALGVLAGALLFPFPIHGGVTFLGAALWEEIGLLADSQTARRDERRDEHFRKALERRFAGDLPFVPGKALAPPWMEAILPDGSAVLYDAESGLIWSSPRTVRSWEPGGDLEPGRRFCAQQAPEGYWALPTEGELYGFWAHEGHRLSPWTGQSTPSVLVDEALRMEIPVWDRGRDSGVAVRCVARSPMAPKAGYPQADVELSRWNTYQLEKAASLRGPH